MLAIPGAEMVPVPAKTFQLPVPVAGMLAASAADAVQTARLLPANDADGGWTTVTVKTFVANVQVPEAEVTLLK
ncbi:hypothetical protein D3C83_166360 [compost metagenome]